MRLATCRRARVRLGRVFTELRAAKIFTFHQAHVYAVCHIEGHAVQRPITLTNAPQLDRVGGLLLVVHRRQVPQHPVLRGDGPFPHGSALRRVLALNGLGQLFKLDGRRKRRARGV